MSHFVSASHDRLLPLSILCRLNHWSQVGYTFDAGPHPVLLTLRPNLPALLAALASCFPPRSLSSSHRPALISLAGWVSDALDLIDRQDLDIELHRDHSSLLLTSTDLDVTSLIPIPNIQPGLVLHIIVTQVRTLCDYVVQIFVFLSVTAGSWSFCHPSWHRC